MAHLHIYIYVALSKKKEKKKREKKRQSLTRESNNRERRKEDRSDCAELVRYFSLKTRGSSHRYYCSSAVHSGDIGFVARVIERCHFVAYSFVFHRHSSLFVPNEKVAFFIVGTRRPHSSARKLAK